MSKKITKLVPFDVNEVLYISRFIKQMNNTTKENVPMSSGQFSTIKLRSLKSFDSEDIKLMCNSFSKRFNNRLNFETLKQGDIYVGTISKT